MSDNTNPEDSVTEELVQRLAREAGCSEEVARLYLKTARKYRQRAGDLDFVDLVDRIARLSREEGTLIDNILDTLKNQRPYDLPDAMRAYTALTAVLVDYQKVIIEAREALNVPDNVAAERAWPPAAESATGPGSRSHALEEIGGFLRKLTDAEVVLVRDTCITLLMAGRYRGNIRDALKAFIEAHSWLANTLQDLREA